MLIYRLKTHIKKPKGECCCHECDLEPQEQFKRPRGELKKSWFQKYSKKKKEFVSGKTPLNETQITVVIPKINLSVNDTKFFYLLIWKSFQSDEQWRLFYCSSILVYQVIQDLVYVN